MKKNPQISNIKYQISEPLTVFIVGPTASGKSGLAMRIAKEFSGEIICADSQTLRKELNIGTAKPTQDERQEVPHHMLDVIEPYERYSVANFQKTAKKHITEIKERRKIPLIVGGTGLYIDALFYDYSIDQQVSVDKSLEDKSVEELQSIIRQNKWVLPANKNNPRHLIGTIRRQGASPIDSMPIENAIIIGIDRSDELLKKRIESRIDKMFNEGFVTEVKKIKNLYGKPVEKIDAIGYPIVMRYLDGEITIDEAKRQFRRGDWQYARKQKAWFKRNKHIIWFKNEEDAYNYVQKKISSQK